MNRLVIIRVGNPDGLWSICNSIGKWSSPECHEQVVRNMVVEGYTVYALFVGTGDKLLMAAKVTGVRQRVEQDITIIPEKNDLGDLTTIIEFDSSSSVDLRQSVSQSYSPAIDSIKFLVGSQKLVAPSIADVIMGTIVNLVNISRSSVVYGINRTYINPEYLMNLNIIGC